ncbi:tetratricopeptide repeat protein [Roseateles noduli]|uniref:tetratricopeptide repeat protein n=1 Tax=Roseateles noduli TaxID=2052484 RepID=UPI003D64BDA7
MSSITTEVPAARLMQPLSATADPTTAVLDRIVSESLDIDALEAMVDLAALTEVEDEARAEAAYRAAISQDPGFVSAYTALTSLLCRQGRQEEALDVVNAALEICNNSAQLHHIRGCVLESAGRLAAAVEAFGRALRLDSALAEPHYHLGLLCERLGAPVTSARHLDHYQRLVASHSVDSQLN